MRTKLKKFRENAQRNNVIEPGKSNYHTIRGQWAIDHFRNTNDIVLELGCGQGEYTIHLAQLDPAKNFVGVDVKGARIWGGSTQALQYQLPNVAFLRTPIEQLDQFFAVEEVAEIYIPFPDPRPRTRNENRRLTSPYFLKLYRHILKPGGFIHLKTDNLQLFEYTLEILQQYPEISELIYTDDLYQSTWQAVHHGIKTKYELKYLNEGVTIKYIRFALGKNN